MIKAETKAAVYAVSIKEFSAYRGCTRTGKDYGFYIIASFQVKTGQYIEILFDKDEELVHAANGVIADLALSFDKRFKPGLLNNEPCLIHHNQ